MTDTQSLIALSLAACGWLALYYLVPRWWAQAVSWPMVCVSMGLALAVGLKLLVGEYGV